MNDDTKIPYGCCRCGCGEKTNIAIKDDPRHGRIKGEPNAYLYNHDKRVSYENYVARRTPKVLFSVDPVTGCWVWQGGLQDGYGRIQVKRKRYKAHVFYYEKKYGPIPKGLVPDHTCRNRACCNPDHIEPVTRAVNVQRGAKAKLTEGDVRRLRAMGKFSTYREVGEAFGISESQAMVILKGKQWKGIT